MKAAVYRKPGPPEVLHIVDLEKPLPDHDQVLVRIHAATVTAGDAILRGLKFPLSLVFKLAFGMGRTKILGHEFCGIVESVGKDVRRFKPGDLVFGSTGNKGGAYAEYICLPENGYFTAKPANLTCEKAAAVPIGANTALDILQRGNIQVGNQVLIYGASGSVGTYAVQIARYFGAQVTGVCSTANVDLVRSIGAENIIDYTIDDFTRSEIEFDVIFDAVGKTSSSACKSLLNENGIFLSVKSPTKQSLENLEFIKDLIESGHLTPVIDSVYSFQDIVEAHRYVEKGHKKGNLVITFAADTRS